MEPEDNDPIIIDNGSGFLKAGFASDDAPKIQLPMVIGYPLADSGQLVGMDQKDCYVGTEAIEKKQFLDFKEPVQQGIIQDFTDMEKIWKHLMDDHLRVSFEDYRIMMTEPPKNPKHIREEMCRKMFEELSVEGLYIGNQAVLSLYAQGKVTGTVVDVGDGISHTVPIYEGYVIPHAVQKIQLAGRDLTDRLN